MGLYLICNYRPNMHHMQRRSLTPLVCTMFRVGRGAGAPGARGAKKVAPQAGARGAAKKSGALILKV